MKRSACMAILAMALCASAEAETFRAMIAGKLTLTDDQPKSISLSYIDSVVIALKVDPRFVRGIELELKVPQPFLKQRGSLAMALYTSLKGASDQGVADLSGERVGFEALPAKLQTVWQIPLRENHGFVASPYVSIPCGVLPVKSLPLLFRIMPVVKGLSDEIEGMTFQLNARAIIGDEGALRVQVRMPENLRDKPYTLRLDGDVIDAGKELMLKSGEHHLAVVSDDYRNENRQIMIERGKLLDLPLDLQDPTPRVTIEAPENAQVWFDDKPVADAQRTFAADPGQHEIRVQIGNYSIVKMVQLRKGQAYKASLLIDLIVTESE